jgi:hypothetical protein
MATGDASMWEQATGWTAVGSVLALFIGLPRVGDWRRHLHAFVNRHIYRAVKMVVNQTELTGPPAADRVGDVVFRLAAPADLQRLDQLEPYGRGARQRTYVEKEGDWLFVACCGDQVVGTRRYSRTLPSASRDGHGLMARLLELKPTQVWSADVWLLPEYRQRGINQPFASFTMRFLASLGYTEQLAAVTLPNLPSLRSSARRGAKRLYYISYMRLFFYERLRISTERPRWLRAALEETPEGASARSAEKPEGHSDRDGS